MSLKRDPSVSSGINSWHVTKSSGLTAVSVHRASPNY